MFLSLWSFRKQAKTGEMHADALYPERLKRPVLASNLRFVNATQIPKQSTCADHSERRAGAHVRMTISVDGTHGLNLYSGDCSGKALLSELAQSCLIEISTLNVCLDGWFDRNWFGGVLRLRRVRRERGTAKLANHLDFDAALRTATPHQRGAERTRGTGMQR